MDGAMADLGRVFQKGPPAPHGQFGLLRVHVQTQTILELRGAVQEADEGCVGAQHAALGIEQRDSRGQDVHEGRLDFQLADSACLRSDAAGQEADVQGDFGLGPVRILEVVEAQLADQAVPVFQGEGEACLRPEVVQ